MRVRPTSKSLLLVLACVYSALAGCGGQQTGSGRGWDSAWDRLTFSRSVKSGPLLFRAALADIEGEMHFVLRMTNKSSLDVLVLRRPDHYSGGFVFKKTVGDQGGGFYGGMNTRVTVGGRLPPRFDPHDIMVLSPMDSTTQWILLGVFRDIIALEDVEIIYLEHAGEGLPRSLFGGMISIPVVPISQNKNGLDG